MTAPSATTSSARSATAQFFANQAVLPHPFLNSPGTAESPFDDHRSDWAAELPRMNESPLMINTTGMYADMEAALRRAQSVPGPWATEFRIPSMSTSTVREARITEVPQSMWDREFARIDVSPVSVDVKGKGRAYGLGDAALDDAFARVTVQSDERPVASPALEHDFTAEFESVWTQMNHERLQTPEGADLASWEADLHAHQMEESADDSLWDLSEMERKYQELTATTRDDSEFSMRYDDDGLPDFGEYEFERENPYLTLHLSESLPTLLQQALASSDPSALTRSALILEAMLQLDKTQTPQFQLWYTLGQVLVRDERDDKGIKALVRAVKDSAGHQDANSAILELAIAYVNQSYDMACFFTLLQFAHSRHSNKADIPDLGMIRGRAIWSVRDAVKDIFISLAREQHAENIVDPDVQVGLGVLLYSEAEYDRAAECFQAALSINPQNAVLWNRLGSCLSNGNRPEEAIGAYRRALEIWPNYTRAIVNIGVACLNMGAHQEAVEHFLSAIAMHDGSASTTAIPSSVKSNDDIWKTLRRTFLAMDRHDLAERALPPERSAEAFRGEGFEF
ncbi:TPR-like protein [Dacryopinax primogenitus]|uniref:TPR-like protein n=1 Tax=Dacryopinax primogenitus (strain DJM 731) TaxID=1858805 RepID=M5FVM8_DACPD|nr:TPR-like protein [Dacryopinax primogenitus]EJT97401.1 TPR-like protein [Dacryopinax primogenitus]